MAGPLHTGINRGSEDTLSAANGVSVGARSKTDSSETMENDVDLGVDFCIGREMVDPVNGNVAGCAKGATGKLADKHEGGGSEEDFRGFASTGICVDGI